MSVFPLNSYLFFFHPQLPQAFLRSSIASATLCVLVVPKFITLALQSHKSVWVEIYICQG